MAGLLRQSGYRTALIGKPHFQPHLDVFQRFDENRFASSGQRGPWYGFDHVESAGHGPTVPTHYTDWLYRHHRDAVGGFATVLTGEGGGDTCAPELHHDPIPADQRLGGGGEFTNPEGGPTSVVPSRVSEDQIRETTAMREPVGLVDVAPTICEIAGIEVPPEMHGAPLPTAAGSGRERVLTTWDSQFATVGMHLRTIHRDGLTCTRYEPSTTRRRRTVPGAVGNLGQEMFGTALRRDRGRAL